MIRKTLVPSVFDWLLTLSNLEQRFIHSYLYRICYSGRGTGLILMMELADCMKLERSRASELKTQFDSLWKSANWELYIESN